MKNYPKNTLSILWILLGAVLVLLSVLEVLDSSLYAGMGGGLFGVGCGQLFKKKRYREDPEYREEVDIRMNDERLRYLRMKSWCWTGYAILVGCAVGSVVAAVIGNGALRQGLAIAVCAIVGVYWISYWILSRRD